MRTIQHFLTMILIFFGINLSYAEQVTFKIDAVIDHIYDSNNALADRLKLGEHLSGTYTFDTTIPDTETSPAYGFYNQVNSGSNGFNLEIRSLSPSLIKSHNLAFHSINTWNSHGDFYYAETKIRSPIGNGLTITFVGLEVFDSTGRALTNDKLTNAPPDITYARDKHLLISGIADGASEDFEIRATVTSIVNKKHIPTTASKDF